MYDSRLMPFAHAVAKIISANKSSAEAILPRWVNSLPIFVDAEEMTPANNLLLELISR